DHVSPLERLGFAVLGLLGTYAGFWCRGPIINVAVPALAVGVAGLLQRPRVRLARWLTLGSTVGGLLALALGARALESAWGGEYSVLVGSRLQTATTLPTFDVALGDLAHAAYPWSAAAPLALAVVAEQRADVSRTRAAVNAAALALVLSLAAAGWLAPTLGVFVLPAVACLAVLVAAALRALEQGRLGSPLLGMAVAALAVVIGFDLRENPEKTLSGFGLAGATLPDGLHASAGWLWVGGACLLGLVAIFCCYEPEAELRGRAFQRAEYARVLRALQQAYDGNLVFALLLVETALVGFLLLCAVSERLVSMPQLESFGSFSRKLVAAGAIALPLTPLAVLGALLLRDVARWLFGGAVTRAQGLLVAFVALGSVASLGFYPALARQVSPTEAIARYRQIHGAGEPLGVVGEQSGAARYQGVPDAQSFAERDVAFEWLTATEPGERRRFLVLRKSDLPELNAQYRALRHTNLPILDASSSEVLLGSNQLRAGEHSDSPLGAVVLDAAPPIQYPLHAVLDEQLEVLGYSLRSASGAPEAFLTPARSYELVLYFRVLAPLSETSWQTFVHLDGFQRRFNADHEPLGGRYPLRLWRPNDVLVDVTEVRLEPNFSPGPYHLYFGFFVGERRLRVSGGAKNEDRVSGGVVQVR
ncbi:MAG TPA: hypothetical protein VEQ59_00395, partial [Polyangiaceae bacterium]|nr:hypothetical protein [Polyangiaceae bacterium]